MFLVARNLITDTMLIRAVVEEVLESLMLVKITIPQYQGNRRLMETLSGISWNSFG